MANALQVKQIFLIFPYLIHLLYHQLDVMMLREEYYILVVFGVECSVLFQYFG